MRSRAAIAVSVSVMLCSISALAQDSAGQPEADGMRFRGAVGATLGLETVSAGGASLSGAMFGAEGRLGLQLNNLIGIYAEPQLSFGSLGGAFGFTGTFTTAAMVDLTLMDRFFAGAGVGYGVLNNPTGPLLEVRGGFYPLMGHGDNGIRRKGLFIGADFRAVFLSSGVTGVLVGGSVGYEAF
jgi:hypothetical protein